MTDTILPVSKCWSCGHEVDKAMAAGQERQPSPGDISVCIRCGAGHIFDKDLSLRKPTDEEAKEINSNPIVRRARVTIAMVNAKLERKH